MGDIKKRKLIHWLGLLGPISLLSYVIAMFFSPLAYPGYDWMSQAVSDLSAYDAPSRQLWQQLASVYNITGIISITLVCVYVEGRLTPVLRRGIYLFGIMNWISAIGYSLFPLTSSGKLESLQGYIHVYVIISLVVLLSIVSLVTIIISGFKSRRYRSLAIWALVAFLFMLVGAIGTAIVLEAYFRIVERFSVLAATSFNAVLGVYLFNGFGESNYQTDFLAEKIRI